MAMSDHAKNLLIMGIVDNTMDTAGDLTAQKIRTLIKEKTDIDIDNEYIEDWLIGFNAIASMIVTTAIVGATTATTNFIVDKATLSNVKNVLFNLRNFASTVGGMVGGKGSHISKDIIMGKSQGSLSEQKLAHYTYLNTAIQSRGTILKSGSSMANTMQTGVQAQKIMDESRRPQTPQGQRLTNAVFELKNMSKQGV